MVPSNTDLLRSARFGGPAFPASPDDCDCGMRLADYFAAHIMAGVLTHDKPDAKTLAVKAYQIAEAMVEESRKRWAATKDGAA